MANIGWGLQMTVLGMGLVFALLALLWALLNLTLFFDRPAGGCVADDAGGSGRSADVPPSQSVIAGSSLTKDRVAAILIAVMRHRQFLQRSRSRVGARPSQDETVASSNWQFAGRIRQNKDWQPGGKR